MAVQKQKESDRKGPGQDVAPTDMPSVTYSSSFTPPPKVSPTSPKIVLPVGDQAFNT
jgi:hypothetical protein